MERRVQFATSIAFLLLCLVGSALGVKALVAPPPRCCGRVTLAFTLLTSSRSSGCARPFRDTLSAVDPNRCHVG